MADQQYTEADVELVDNIIDEWWSAKVLDVWPNFEPAARLVLDALAAAGRLPPPTDSRWTFPLYAKVDALLPDGQHRYWSTHCRHGNHEACSATEMTGVNVFSPEGHHSAIEREPAQCKTCASPCICPCHAGSADG